MVSVALTYVNLICICEPYSFVLTISHYRLHYMQFNIVFHVVRMLQCACQDACMTLYNIILTQNWKDPEIDIYDIILYGTSVHISPGHIDINT